MSKPIRFGHETTAIEQASHQRDAGGLPDFYDPSSVPGHAEQVMANEIAESRVMTQRAKESYYKRFGVNPGQLPAELAWVRVRGPDGRRSYNADVAKMEFARRGYRPATTSDLDELGWGMPVAGEVVGDNIYREDTMLFIVDGEQAEKLKKQQRDQAHAAEGAEGEHDRPDETWVAEESREFRDAALRPYQSS